MKLNKLILENLLAFESLKYNISRTPLFIQNKNLEEEYQKSNLKESV